MEAAAELQPRARAPGFFFPLLACTAGAAGFALLLAVHALRVRDFAGDDRLWLSCARKSLAVVWSSASPYLNYRPTFVSWLWLVRHTGLTSPGALGVATLLLNLGLCAAFFWAVRPLLIGPRALIAATLFLIHPMRQEQSFWLSDGTDVLSLLMTMICIGMVLRPTTMSSRFWTPLVFLAILSALACLAKETALLIPVLILVLPAGGTFMRRAMMALAAGAGLCAASVVSIAVLGGLGRSAQVFQFFRWLSAAAYPIRLWWPGDLESAVMSWRLSGAWGRLAVGASVSAGLLLALVGIHRRRWREPEIRLGLILLAAGLLTCIVRQEDRSLGLGCAGLSLLIACLEIPALGSTLAVPSAAVVVLGAVWAPLWIDAERRWTEVSIVSRDAARSAREWRSEVGAGRRLVSLGLVTRIGEGTKAPWIAELDECSLDLLSIEGPRPVLPVNVLAAGVSEVRLETAGDAHLSSACHPYDDLGITRVDCDAGGYARSAVFRPGALEATGPGKSCGPDDVRYWDGRRFAPIPMSIGAFQPGCGLLVSSRLLSSRLR